MDLRSHPHRRYNPLTRQWVLVSPQRTQRPWLGQTEKVSEPVLASYDPACYLCPGNTRAGGARNPDYTAAYVFDNDFAALLPDTPPGRFNESGLLLAENERGTCRVVCFSPDHSLTLARMTPEQIRPVVDIWAAQSRDLMTGPLGGYVQIFENRGEMMGCSNPHPHCQIWAGETIPNEIATEGASLRDYKAAHGSCLLCDYLALETRLKERIVLENASFTVVAPFWAVWPFETLLLPKRHVSLIDGFHESERNHLARILQQLTACYDALFEVSFPYTMGFHQSPAGANSEAWHFHGHFYPPLLRSATVRKFMVGYEMLATPQRDITIEDAAMRLRGAARL